MLRRLMLMAALMLLLVGHIEDSSLAQTASSDSYAAAMNTWEESQNISVSSQARELIVSGFDEFRGRLSDFGGNVRWKDSTRTLNQSLVIYYLGDVRDHKVDKERGGIAISAPLGRSSSETSEWRFSTIESRDVEAYPVKEFIAKVEPVLKGKKGELHTISHPPGASIVLDDVKKKGFTEKITVEDAGEHRIRVFGGGLDCRDKVTVPDGGTVRFQCP
jgi:hypothetical protein